MRNPSTLRLAFAVLALTAAGPAAADGEYYFRTPSGNIHCGYFDFDGPPYLRCDISEYTPTAAPRPEDCDLDWGGAFEIDAVDQTGSLVCHGDTVVSPDAVPLDYGENFARGGISCLSEKKGLTCENELGHGFFLSRAKQEVF
jgi:hypothetical protein